MVAVLLMSLLLMTGSSPAPGKTFHSDLEKTLGKVPVSAQAGNPPRQHRGKGFQLGSPAGRSSGLELWFGIRCANGDSPALASAHRGCCSLRRGRGQSAGPLSDVSGFIYTLGLERAVAASGYCCLGQCADMGAIWCANTPWGGNT